MGSVILSEASRSLIARGAVEGPAVGWWRRRRFPEAQCAHTHAAEQLDRS